MGKLIGKLGGFNLPEDIGNFLLETFIPSVFIGVIGGIIVGLFIGIAILVLTRKVIFFKRSNKILHFASKINYLFIPVIFAIWGSAMGPIIGMHRASNVLIDKYTPEVVEITNEYSIIFQQYLITVFKIKDLEDTEQKFSISNSLDYVIDEYVEKNPIIIEPASDGYFDRFKAKTINKILKASNNILLKSYINSYLTDKTADYTGLDADDVSILMDADLNDLTEINIARPFIMKLKKFVNNFFFGNYLSMTLMLILLLSVSAVEIIISRYLLRKRKMNELQQ